MTLFIQERWNGKLHKRSIENKSCSYCVEGKFLVVRDYYTNKALHRFNVEKYGSISYWVEYEIS